MPRATSTTKKKATTRTRSVEDSSNDSIQIVWSDEEDCGHLRVLLCGSSGVGKTRLSGQFPNPIVFNYERRLETIRKLHIPVVQIPRKGDTYKVTLKLLRDLRDKKNDFQGMKPYPQTLVIDSITHLSDMMERDIVKEHEDYGKTSRAEALTLPDYNIIQRRLFTILDTAKELPLHLVVTSLVVPSQDDLQHINYDPKVTGSKLGPQLPRFFGEVYYLTNKKAEGKTIYSMSTASDSSFSHCKSCYGVPEEVEDPSYDKLKKYFK